MKIEFDILKKNRKSIIEIVDDLSIEQLNKIPAGFRNNIIWNIAHLVVTQQLLCYNLSGLDMAVPELMVKSFRKGTFPQQRVSKIEYETYKQLLIELPPQFEIDYENGIFKNYQNYTTSLNVKVVDIDSAIGFINFHEGIHLGVILTLRKLV